MKNETPFQDNVHDEGGVMPYDEMAKVLSAAGENIETLVPKTRSRPLRMPFLWVYGRRDFTISIMGANIYPEDLEQCLYAVPDLARITRSFCQSLSEVPNGGVRPRFLFEVEVEPDENLRQRFAEWIMQQLLKLNADFREAWREHPETLVPEIQLYYIGQGPFKENSGRIKQMRMV